MVLERRLEEDDVRLFEDNILQNVDGSICRLRLRDVQGVYCHAVGG